MDAGAVNRLARGIARIACLALVVACSDDEAQAPSTFTPGEATSETKPAPTVDEPPTGPCADEGAVQVVRTPAGLEACRGREAGAIVSSSPNEWTCTCTNATWRCEITSGGFGAMTCP